MKSQVSLENKEIRQILAKALKIPEKAVIPLRYGFAIEGFAPETVSGKMRSFLEEEVALFDEDDMRESGLLSDE